MEGGMNAELWLSRADETRPQVNLQQAVWEQLRWVAEADIEDLDVDVTDFVATLRGTVPAYRARLTVNRAAERVPGIRAVVDQLAVVLPVADTRADTLLLAAVSHALLWDVRVPHAGVMPRISNGWITLQGTVSQYSERLAAEQAVENLTGVRGVTNLIAVAPPDSPRDLQRQAEAAVERMAPRGTRISVTTQDRTVALRGRVHSLAERAAAERAVWEVPGVAAVEDLLTVSA